MASKASEEGKASSRRISGISSKRRVVSSTVLERHDEWEAVKLLGGSEGFLQLKLPLRWSRRQGKTILRRGREGEGEAAEWDMLIRSEEVV
jgi:hypothetical protein